MKIENTFGINATCRELITYRSEEELRRAVGHIQRHYAHLPLLNVGCGSNLLLLDDFPGVVLKSDIKGFRTLSEETDDTLLVEVGSGEACDDFIATAIRNGWYGMENLSLIPGQVGAAAVQNIGAYGVEAANVIHQVQGISLEDGSTHTWKRDECGYGYRQSIFKKDLWGKYAITRVTFRLDRNFRPMLEYGGLKESVRKAGYTAQTITASQLRDVIIGIRRAKLPDPAVLGNAGSFFKNPIVTEQQAALLLARYPDMPTYPTSDGDVKLSAGWLIEQTGWKGKRLGPAAVHKQQALVLVNLGGATGHDILRLSKAIEKDVHTRFGIELIPEVNAIAGEREKE